MIRTLRALAAAGAAAALVVTATASPAAAKTRSFTDKKDDATSALDITKVKVTNKKSAVVVRLSVPGLRKSKVGGVMVGVRTKAKGRPEFVSTKMRMEGAGWMPLMLMDEDSEELAVACKGDRVRFNKKSITVRLPQRCLGANMKAVKVVAAVFGRDDEILLEEEPEEGPEAQIDVYPSLTSERMSPWVRYR
ncbi:hypothetical protein H4N58_12455 [Mumia sp. ZJ1417]|uniref:hypothetical protein n=1 Tax=Mumia sp. ZJ1417 TaxID=2708082 RepID=UPI0014226F09|nr:hypothetical protein [Mumia sp. ZJ1417]QMW65033.1 hypothetical protein H4N58_12455 [Mumia sp. ZJ1417]